MNVDENNQISEDSETYNHTSPPRNERMKYKRPAVVVNNEYPEREIRPAISANKRIVQPFQVIIYTVTLFLEKRKCM